MTTKKTTAASTTVDDAVTGTILEGYRGKVFTDRYARKNAAGESMETYPEQMFDRVATAIAEVEPTKRKRETAAGEFRDLLADFKFVPGGRILSGAGTGHEVVFYNCFVCGIGEDPTNPNAPRVPQLEGVEARQAFFASLKQMTDIMSRSGGVGMNFTSLPAKGTPITEQDGRGRNGKVRPVVALHVGHTDLFRFLDDKDNPLLANVDIAVIVGPAFHDAVSNDADWTLSWEGQPGETVKAVALWERLTTSDGRAIQLVNEEILYPRYDAYCALEDSRESIVDGLEYASLALYRGETPIVDYSALRPHGAYIKTVNGTSSGPIAWMYPMDAVARLDDGCSPVESGIVGYIEIASTITGKTIIQGGSRRGALMAMVDDTHPDVLDFIQAKRIDAATGRPVMIEHANMSVAASDAFMAAVKAKTGWSFTWKGEVVDTVAADKVWDVICTAAWTTAEPGLVFMERSQNQANTGYYESIRCVNPCGGRN